MSVRQGTLTEHLFIGLVRAFIVCAALMGGSEAAFAQDHPNVLFVLTDDVGWGDIRAYNPDSQLTLPAIDQLAAEGMVFTDAHTSAAKCAPSRYSIISGNYQWRGKKNWGQWNYKGGPQIRAGQLTLGHILQQAGYRTAIVGKHHLGSHVFLKNSNSFASGAAPDSDVDFSRQLTDGPLATGFDYSFVALRGIQDSPYAFFENDLLSGNATDLIHWANGNYGDTQISNEGIGLPDWNTREVGPTLLEKAVDFIDTHHGSNVASGTNLPFFLYYNTQGVHYPHKPPILLRTTPILGSTGVSDRTDLIREIDEMLNILQAELASRGLLDNTLIVFTSDNGASRFTSEINQGHNANRGLRGSKGMIFEGGHRVPLIAKWGDGTEGGSVIRPGVVSNALIGAQDIYATLASLVGVGVAEDQGRDSFNMLPIFLGQTVAPIRDHMIHEADQNEGGGQVARHFAFRDGDWKLILDGQRDPTHLFNLANDPQETTDLINRSSEAVRIDQMHSRFTLLRNADRSAPSIGGAFIQTPDTVGLAQVDAENLILSVGLNVGAVSLAASNTISPGKVVSQSPLANTSVTVGSIVSLVISSGPPSTQNSSPTSTINSPADGANYDLGDVVSFSGDADDTEDGDLSSGLVWTSNRDGLIGMGASFSTSSLSTGGHTITASISDSGGLFANDSVSITVVDPGGSGAFLQGGDGTVSIEAEHFDSNIAVGGASWLGPISASGASAQVMEAPDTKTPRLEYAVDFNRTGLHYVWVRSYATDGGSNSVWLGMDGNWIDQRINVSPFNSWQWEGPYAMNISSIGVHTLGISRRETATQVDKIYISGSSGDLPSGTGPAESPR